VGKLRTLVYILDDGQEITTRQLAAELGVTESAARNRLTRHSDPKKVFEPHNPAKGGKRPTRKAKKLAEQKQADEEYEKELWKIVMQMGTKKYD
jgi:DeoR/GlpR family transcriptional regulator of sugar metabolism